MYKNMIIMNKKMTYLSIIGVVPLLLIVASPSLLVPSEAVNTSVFDGGGAQVTYQYGIRENTVVCGDHLCNPSHTVSAVNPEMVKTNVSTAPAHMPTVEIKSAHNYLAHEKNAYIVTLRVAAGDANLANIIVSVSSDVGGNGGVITSLFADKSSVLVVRMQAMDPASIHASISGFHIRDDAGTG
jgi:hypothetical protein